MGGLLNGPIATSTLTPNYLASSKSLSTCPPDPDTMTVTTLEAIASLSGRNNHMETMDIIG